MTNTSKLFQALRLAGYTAGQRRGDCRSCAAVSKPHMQVFTHDQSYKPTHTMVYFHDIDGREIADIAQENDIPFLWDGTQEQAFTIQEKR